MAQPLKQHALVRTKWHLECFRKGQKIWEMGVDNIVTTEGINALLETMFKQGTGASGWYVVLSEDGTAGADNTYGSMGFTETEDYDETERPAWVPGDVAAGQVSNGTSKAEFTFNDTVTIYGVGLVGGGTAGSVKLDTNGGGVLYGYADFPESKDVIDDDVLRVTVTASGS